MAKKKKLSSEEFLCKIDCLYYRYDGRGHIYDLKPYDADSVDRHHFDLSDREKAVEKACDEERYLELHTDAAEQKVYEGKIFFPSSSS